MKMKMITKKKHTLLLGEGVHQHTLYGNFKIDTAETEFAELEVLGIGLWESKLSITHLANKLQGFGIDII
jgi:hypothetical protein